VLSTQTLLILTAFLVTAAGTYAWLYRRRAGWIFTKVAVILAAAYIILTIVILATEPSSDVTGAAESLGAYLILFSPFLVLPLLVVALLADSVIAVMRRLRGEQRGDRDVTLETGNDVT
jgi:ABC-type sulfate transport system permease component